MRLLKQQTGLERFRVRSLRAIVRLVFLAMLAIAALILLALRTLSLAERLAQLSQPLRRAKGQIYYRLAVGYGLPMNSRSFTAPWAMAASTGGM